MSRILWSSSSLPAPEVARGPSFPSSSASCARARRSHGSRDRQAGATSDSTEESTESGLDPVAEEEPAEETTEEIAIDEATEIAPLPDTPALESVSEGI